MHHISPNRRRSISVLNQGSSANSSQRHRRRAYSMAPTDKLSPSAKARRLMAPRKSILKPILQDDSTQSMDFTEVQPPTGTRQPRKSVSFADNAHVRLFEVNRRKSVSFQQSPEDESDPLPQHHRRRSSLSRRRSSTTFTEYGEQSMDMDLDDTAPMPHDFLNNSTYYAPEHLPEHSLYSEQFSDDADGGEDMDITEAIPGTLIHRRSSSSHPRTSLATSSQSHSENQPLYPQIPEDTQINPEDDTNTSDLDLTSSSLQSQSFMSDVSVEPMEFTIPLNQSLRPPAEEDEVWRQLRAATHAGHDPNDPPEPYSDDLDPEGGQYPTGVDDELTDAVNRLLKARESLGLSPHVDFPNVKNGEDPPPSEVTEDSFASTEESFDGGLDDIDSGNHTINITKVRSSWGSNMDETSVYFSGSLQESHPDVAQATIPSQQVLNAEQQPPPVITIPESVSSTRPTVFSAPTGSGLSTKPYLSESLNNVPRTPAPPTRSPAKQPQSLTIPKPFSFTFRPPPPARAEEVEPSVSSSDIPPVLNSATPFATMAMKSPLKRPVPIEFNSEHHDGPSATKKQAVGKLSPAKKAIFEKPSLPSYAAATASATARRTSAVRRPSGYFAQRKSVGSGTLPLPAADTVDKGKQREPPSRFGGRASLGSALNGNLPIYPDLPGLQPEAISNQTSSVARASRSPVSSPEKHVTIKENTTRPTTTIFGNPSTPSSSPALHAEVSVLSLPEVTLRRQSPIPPDISISATSPKESIMPPSNMLDDASMELEDAPQDLNNGNLESDIGRPPYPPTFTEKWRDNIQDMDPEDDEGPPISIEQFFEMTGIRFMDEITAPRRSTIHPGHLKPSRRRSLNTSQSDEVDSPIPLAEFFTALSIEVPQLELYSTIAGDLNAWIEESKKICKEADEEAIKMTPGLFREFAYVDDSEKEVLLHQLKLIKANNHGTARSQWYDWKKEWVEQLQGSAETAFLALESDAKVLEDIIKEAQSILPTLREEYEQVLAELEKEKADVAEVENSDQDYLNELKSSIAEQDVELEAYRSDVSEAKAKLDRLREKYTEIEQQRQEASTAIAQAEHTIHIQKESTSVEVFRLKNELEALQDLHQWHTDKITPNLMRLIYASKYSVSIPCVQYKPKVDQADIQVMGAWRTKERDPYPAFTQLMIQNARNSLTNLGVASPQRIIEILGDYWSCCSLLKTQLTFLQIKYPLLVEAVTESRGQQQRSSSLKVTATIVLASVKSKAFISFVFDEKTYSQWPMSIESVECQVKIAYGSADSQAILNAVRVRLSQASPADNHGCLLDACIEATEQFE
ncbi:hypothetical protein ABKN59_009315 [Abortiporus biennis]